MGWRQFFAKAERKGRADHRQRFANLMTEGERGDGVETYSINAQPHQLAVLVFNFQVFHYMLLLPDNPALTVELCYRSALLKALLNRVVTAFA